MTLNRVRVAVGLGLVACGVVSTPAQAADPPASWTNERLLDCEGQAVVAYLTPAGFGSAFHVSGSTEVFKPVHVEVTFPGQSDPVVTVDVPGFADNNAPRVHCRYTDPAGLFVDLVAVRG